MKAMKLIKVSTSGMFIIENSTSHSSSWVLDTRCDFYICNNIHELKKNKGLYKGKMDLRVGNKAKVIALPVGTYYFTLPSGLILEHDICYFVPILSRNIIFISNLTLNRFKFIIEEKYYIFIIMMFFYRYDDYTNCLYIFDFEILKFIITNKKNRLDNQYPLSLWHCRLGHINKMRITELHKEKYFNNFGYDS